MRHASLLIPCSEVEVEAASHTSHDENRPRVGVVQQRGMHQTFVVHVLVCLCALHLAVQQKHLQQTMISREARMAPFVRMIQALSPAPPHTVLCRFYWNLQIPQAALSPPPPPPPPPPPGEASPEDLYN